MPAVSIITPTYNRPELLTQAIESILAQTFTDVEMLVVDDGSLVSAQSVVLGFGDCRVRFIRQSHAGRSVARNTGLAAARGALIGFLDDDDLYHPHKIAHEVAFLNAHPDIDLVGSGLRTLQNDEKVIAVWEPWAIKPDLNAGNCLFGCPLVTCSVLIRRHALEKMDHYFDPDLSLVEDGDFFLRLLLSGARFGWVREVLSDYRLFGERPLEILTDKYKTLHRVFEKIFARSDLPPGIADQRQSVFIHSLLMSAWQAYAYQLDKTAQRFLLRALIMEPRLADEEAVILLEGLSTTARNTLYVREPNSYINHVLDHLPTMLRHLASRREEINQILKNQIEKAKHT